MQPSRASRGENMRRIDAYHSNEGTEFSGRGARVDISLRDYRLLMRVARAAETIRRDRECTIVLARALDALNQPKGKR